MINNLSKTMLATIDIMRDNNNKLERWKGGFWTYEGCITKYTETIIKYLNFYDKAILKPYSIFTENMKIDKVCPIWSCDVRTLRALAKRNIVILEEDKQTCNLIIKY